MVRFLDEANLEEFQRRFGEIGADETPEFGRMTPIELMAHVNFTIEMSLGEKTDKDISNIMTRTVLRYLFFHVLTNWPKGKIKAPDAFTPAPESDDYEVEKRRAIDVLGRFVAAAKAEPDRVEVSPMFGAMTLSYWRRIHGVHLNHHLKQYRRGM